MVSVGMGGEPLLEAPRPRLRRLGEQFYHQRAESEKSANQIEHHGIVSDDVAAIIIGDYPCSRVVPPEIKRYHGDDGENCQCCIHNPDATRCRRSPLPLGRFLPLVGGVFLRSVAIEGNSLIAVPPDGSGALREVALLPDEGHGFLSEMLAAH